MSLLAHSETGETPVARIVVSEDGREKQAESRGSGPVDATFKAIETIVASGARSATLFGEQHHQRHRLAGRGTRAAVEVGRIVNGQGADTDIVVASAKAYMNALNKLHSKLERLNPQA